MWVCSMWVRGLNLTLIVVIFCRQSTKPSSPPTTCIWFVLTPAAFALGVLAGWAPAVVVTACWPPLPASTQRECWCCRSCTGSDADLRFWKSWRWYNWVDGVCISGFVLGLVLALANGFTKNDDEWTLEFVFCGLKWLLIWCPWLLCEWNDEADKSKLRHDFPRIVAS